MAVVWDLRRSWVLPHYHLMRTSFANKYRFAKELISRYEKGKHEVDSYINLLSPPY